MEASPVLLSAEQDDVRVQKLSHAVAERLRGQIIAGQRQPGERLPPETDLLLQFKVSRPIIREALRILEVESLITLGRGARSGATVLGPTVQRAAEYAAMVLVGSGTSMGDLHEARMVLEPHMIAHLTKKRDKKLLEDLQKVLDGSTAAVAAGDMVAALAGVNDFHAALMRASENRALILMVDMLKVLAQKAQDVLVDASAAEKGALKANMVKTIAAYQQLVELLRQGKAEEAQSYWRRYMERAHAFLDKTGLGARKLQHG